VRVALPTCSELEGIVRIAQVSPLYESVPPRQYGGTERVVFYLTEELVRLGHDVTLFASADSETSAHLVPCCPAALRTADGSSDAIPHHFVMLERIERTPDAFDVLHFHCDYLHFPVSRRAGWAAVTTLHGRLDIPDLQPLYDEYQEMPVVSISDCQRQPLPQANWYATVHHGLPVDLYASVDRPGDYLLFLGRVSPEKRVDRAIEIARRAGIPLKIAAKVDRQDHEYFEARVRPLLSERFVEFLGEIGEREKGVLLGGAAALLFPIDWSEPFGLVMIEAMACGTPVVAWRAGSVPEVMVDGITGFVVDNMDDAVRAVRRAASLDRRRCRQVFEQRFTAERMARDYLRVYERVAADHVAKLEGAFGHQAESA
jgi:glycosyltransferase involved in cell wall biosynthesis